MVESPQKLDRVFRALADPTRRAILARLAQGGRSVTEIAEPFHMSLAAVSKHIKVLEDAKLIGRTWEGREARLSVDPEGLKAANAWLDRYREFWTSRLDSLEQYLTQKRRTKRDGRDKP